MKTSVSYQNCVQILQFFSGINNISYKSYRSYLYKKFFYLSSDEVDGTNRLFFLMNPTITGSIYLFKVNNGNTRAIQFSWKKFRQV